MPRPSAGRGAGKLRNSPPPHRPRQHRQASRTQKRGHLSPSVPAPLSDGQCLTIPRGVGMVGRCIDPYRARVCECQWVRNHCAPPVRTIDSDDNEQWSRCCKLCIAALAYLVSNTHMTCGANEVKAEEYRGGTSSFSG